MNFTHETHLYLRGPCLLLWQEMNRAGTNKPVRVASVSCHFVSAIFPSVSPYALSLKSLQPMQPKFAGDERFGLKATIGAGPG
jgi:hypothetical protein